MEQFSEIKIDTSAIDQADLNIEKRTRTNLFQWNGQFSPQFVEAILSEYCNSDSVVLDPFLGSGTTLCECARLGIEGYGVELNPSAYYMAKTYELCNLSQDERTTLVLEIDNVVQNIALSQDIIPDLSNEYVTSTDYKKDIYATIMILLDVYNHNVDSAWILNKWNKLKNIIVDLPVTTSKIRINMGDARHILLEDNYADIVFTSPPYINVFNYHQKYRRSVEQLGFDVLKIAHKEFGSNRKHRGNRLYTVIQYCIDMALAVKEFSRVSKENARMIFVVGRESVVLGIPFCNSELIYQICCKIFKHKLLLRQERSFKNRFGQIIYEDILHFCNNKSILSMSDDLIVDGARKIAKQVLHEKLAQQENQPNYALLLMAIDNANKIKESEDTI